MVNNSIALIVIDAQKEYGSGGALAIAGIQSRCSKILKLLSAARKNGLPIVHVRHISPNPGDSDFAASSEGIRFLPELEPTPAEFVLTKHYPGSFTNPDLDRFLMRKGVEQLIICGFASFLCCDTTAREAFQKGYKVFFVEDAIASFDLPEFSGEQLHKVSCAIQKAMFSEVVTTNYIVEQVLSRLQRQPALN